MLHAWSLERWLVLRCRGDAGVKHARCAGRIPLLARAPTLHAGPQTQTQTASSRRRRAGPAGARGRRAGHARLPALLARVRRARAGGRAARRRAPRVPARRPRLRLGQGAAPPRRACAQRRLTAILAVGATRAGSQRRRAATRCPAVHPRVRLAQGIINSNLYPPCAKRVRRLAGCRRVWGVCRSRAAAQEQTPPA